MKPLAVFALAALAGCGPLVPATTPPQLGSTPGPAVVVLEDAVIMGQWRVPTPPGWKVVKNSTADAPALSVALVSPDEQMLIIASQSPLPASPDEAGRETLFEQRLTAAGSAPLYVMAQAAPDQRDALRPVWEDFLAGLASAAP
jgi:hypothetical protein